MAESEDGLHWQRPELGLIEHEGATANNILWQGAGPEQCGVHGFAPFKDPNPDAESRHLYKAVGGTRHATQGDLYAMGSPDGIHWSLLQDEPILKQHVHGSFDSQNLAFWDVERGEYRMYFRDFLNRGTPESCRVIRTARSDDFVHWADIELLEYPDAPREQLYTNQVQPYFRAPHIFL
ncbi:MAG: hypothetical protein GY851_28935, partial [bacterium]|nr:hypothetical protein [bacterium]